MAVIWWISSIILSLYAGAPDKVVYRAYVGSLHSAFGSFLEGVLVGRNLRHIMSLCQQIPDGWIDETAGSKYFLAQLYDLFSTSVSSSKLEA